MQDLGVLGESPFISSSNARGINSLGQTVGRSGTADSLDRAFVSNNGVMQDIGSLGGSYSEASDINDKGQIVGFSLTQNNGPFQAFLYDSANGMQDLGNLGGRTSEAQAINEYGQIVGSSKNINDQNRAFIYENGSMLDLTSLVEKKSLGDWILLNAMDINNNGWIVGTALNTTTQQSHAYLLSVPVSEVPLPAPILLFAPALVGLLSLRKKMK